MFWVWSIRILNEDARGRSVFILNHTRSWQVHKATNTGYRGYLVILNNQSMRPKEILSVSNFKNLSQIIKLVHSVPAEAKLSYELFTIVRQYPSADGIGPDQYLPAIHQGMCTSPMYLPP